MITFWFAVLVLAWVLYFVLEGFDFGVGILSFLGRDEHERGAALRTIGPFWDGNEVWLVAAVGVTFAAFPAWYAALMSALYLPLVMILLLLAVRGVALEFRGKHDSPSWRRRADLLLAVSSTGVVLLWGAVLGILVDGLALGADGEVTGTGLGRSLGPLLTPAAGLGALAALLAAVLLGATFPPCAPPARSAAGHATSPATPARPGRSPFFSSASVRAAASPWPPRPWSSSPACCRGAPGRRCPSPPSPSRWPPRWPPSSPPTATWYCAAPSTRRGP
jgi:cytochrome d ubiquinol oxidase subunit II